MAGSVMVMVPPAGMAVAVVSVTVVAAEVTLNAFWSGGARVKSTEYTDCAVETQHMLLMITISSHASSQLRVSQGKRDFAVRSWKRAWAVELPQRPFRNLKTFSEKRKTAEFRNVLQWCL